MKNRNKHTFGKLLAAIQAVLSLAVIVMLFTLDMLPMRYIVAAVLVLAGLFWVVLKTQYSRKRRHIAGKILAVFLCIVLGYVCYYMARTNLFLDEITSYSSQTDNVIVAVRADDPAETIYDAADYQFGILEYLDRDLTDQTIEAYQEQLGTELAYTTYDGLRALIDALFSGEVQALIYNNAWDEPMEDMEPGYHDQIKILEVWEIEVDQEMAESDVAVTQEPFSVYISGVDEYGIMEATGRSDVNMFAVVNPQTYEILLVVTPRDYYVAFPGYTDGNEDKLTHAGNFGVQASMETLGSIYDITFDHYVRINFTSFIEIIDALDGVDVYSEQPFQADNYGTQVDIVEGYNSLNGEEALAFVRERYNLQEGDFQRGRNQQAMLTAMLEKATSSAILTNYVEVLESLGSNLDTSLTQQDISALVKMQLSENIEWEVTSVAATGTPSMEYCYSLGSSASVVLPDYDSAEEIKAQIAQICE